MNNEPEEDTSMNLIEQILAQIDVARVLEHIEVLERSTGINTTSLQRSRELIVPMAVGQVTGLITTAVGVGLSWLLLLTPEK